MTRVGWHVAQKHPKWYKMMSKLPYQRPNAVEFVAEQPLFPQVNLPGGACGHISADERYLDMPYGA